MFIVRVENIFLVNVELKGTVNVLLSDPLFKDWQDQFAMLPFKLLSEKHIDVFLPGKLLNY